TKPKRERTRKPREVKSIKEVNEVDDITSGDDNLNSSGTVTAALPIPPKKPPKVKAEKKVKEETEEVKSEEESKEKEEIPHEKEKKKPKREKKEPKKKSKKQMGPMHFTANSEPRALEIIGDLDPSIFNECKEKMRPVKKALKALDNPDQTLTETEQVNHTRQCLLQIGDQINKCLDEYKDPDQVKEWRRLVGTHVA
ncbi:unnamed protein product, partial [Timema podura]|nr:unnamed protein product [Timema podura]